MRISTIAFVVAMEEEWGPLRDALDLEALDGAFPRHVPMRAFQRAGHERRVVLVCTGRDRRHPEVSLIGTQPATLAAHLAVSTFKPDVLISAGSAGGFAARGARIGDVYLSAGAFRFHDRLIPLAGYDEYGVGSYPSLDVSRVAVDLGLKLGEVSTGDSFETLDAHQAQFDHHAPALKDMEAAAIAWVATLSTTPFFAIKAVSDLVDDASPPADQFSRNLEDAMHRLSRTAPKVIDYCMGATLHDLGIGS